MSATESAEIITKDRSGRAVQIRQALQPGDIGAITRLHGILYQREYGFGIGFEAYVAEGLARFAVDHRPELDRVWIADVAGEVAGSIAIVRHADGSAQLRWFILRPDVRGAGLGRRLLNAALEHCREAGAQFIFLWTVAGLGASRRLYEEAGFRLTHEQPQSGWGPELTEQRYQLSLG